MKKILVTLLLGIIFSSTVTSNQMPFSPMQEEGELKINNSILAKVNDNTISVLDVIKKMDLLFHKSYPQLLDSKSARFQFYQGGWKNVLNDMIHTELMLAEAQAKEIKISDGEIREEMENRFGPNMMLTLDKIGISFQDAWKMVKNEMIVLRMNWFFVNSKAIQKVTPQLIRQAYREYCIENPAKEEWCYQVVTVRSEEKEKGEAIAQKAYDYLIEAQSSEKSWEDVVKLGEPTSGCTLQISPEYQVETKDLSESHKQVLASLKENEFSKSLPQSSRFDKKNLFRIFYLKKHNKGAEPLFEAMAPKIRDDLLQKVAIEESQNYLERLRKQYAHGQNLQETLPDNFTPFEWGQKPN